MDSKLEGSRRVERPKLRWVDGVVDDLRKLGVQRCWMVARYGQSWKRVRREAEPHCEL
jgi:hypothetical protein